MKKTKKLIALILALTMIFTFMAMSASAATTEIQPRFTCSKCGGTGLRTRTTRLYIEDEPFVENITCSTIGFLHAHFYAPSVQYNYCGTCGYQHETVSYNATYCPHRGYLN